MCLVVLLVYSMRQCFNMPVLHGHGRGKRLGTCLVCTACVVAIAACNTGDASRCPNSFHRNKQHAESHHQLCSCTNNVCNEIGYLSIYKYIRLRRSRQLLATSYLHTSVLRRFNSLASIRYNATHNTAFVILKLTRISFRNLHYNFAQLAHCIAFISHDLPIIF